MQYEIIEELKGHTITKIDRVDDYGEELIFHRDDGKRVIMYHGQDCCEHVRIEDIDGDLDDLVGSPLVEAEYAWRDATDDETTCDDSGTWTFYKLGTARGFVNIRWLGESNGYYSEDVYIRVE